MLVYKGVKTGINGLSIAFLFFMFLSNFNLFSQDSLQKPSRQAAFDAFSKGDYEKAFNEYSLLLQSYSKDPLYKYYSGVSLVKMNRDPQKASILLQEAISGSLDIKNIPEDALFYLGRSQQMSGKFTDAINSYNSFKEKVGKKKAVELNVSEFIGECEQGKGYITDSAVNKEIAFNKSNEGVVAVEVPKEKITIQTEKTPAIPPQRKDVSKEYDRVLSDAMKYQVKADSLNSLVSEYKKEYNKLNPAQKQVVNSRITEMEKLASQYQKLADEKFNSTSSQPPTQKEKPGNASIPENITGQEIYSFFKVETDPAKIKAQRISIDQELPDGLIYKIQIGVFSKPLDPSFFKGISPVTGVRTAGNNAVKYFVGLFRRLNDANRALISVKQLGFRDSFITAVSEGKAVSLERAAILENDWGRKPLMIFQEQRIADTIPPTLIFRVEIIRSEIPLNSDISEAYRKMAGNKGFEVLQSDGGTLVYLIGKFITFESASEYVSLLQRNGYREAKVVSYLGKKEVPLETAKQLFDKQK